MKAIADSLSEDYRSKGAWGTSTLDSLFKQTAARHPRRVALVDAPDKNEWTGGTPRQLTYEEADREIDRLAGFYRAVGLTADSVLGLQSPNTVETVIAFLAGLRADLIVSPIPMHWRQGDLLTALNAVGAKGLIAADRIETRSTGLSARDAAADIFSLRFVFGLGQDIPDGLIELAPMLEEMGDELVAPVSERTDAADHIATLCWSRMSKEPLPVTRSHNHWVAAAKLALTHTPMADGATLLVPYGLSGLTGLGAGLTPWLLCGGTLHLHHARSLGNLARHANQVRADYILAPGPLAAMLSSSLSAPKRTVAAAWNISSPSVRAFVTRHDVVDLHVADEYGMVGRLRNPDGTPDPVTLGSHADSTTDVDAPALLHLGATDSKSAATKLRIKGPAAPGRKWHSISDDQNWKTDNLGFIETDISIEPENGELSTFGVPGQYAPGGADLTGIDEIFQNFPGVQDAAAFLVEDEILGGRLYAALVPLPGTAPDAKAFFSYLDTNGVDLIKIPHRVLVLTALPRTEDGQVDREKLTMRTQRMPAKVA
ncbi:MAG: acyl--CoA ligase [Rhodobacteraceae bacterium]|nr:acyl--CoA ligase [Paracoccaceae bacterium]